MTLKTSDMTQEEKELLLKDLCARLPYGVKLRYVEDLVVKKESHTITLNNIYLEHIINGDADIKPYLRPLSSMTEEEEKEYNQLCYNCQEQDSVDYNITELDRTQLIYVVDWLNAHHFDYNITELDRTQLIYVVDWLNAHHFDYRELIERGLGIDCTGLNIYENEKSI